MEAMVLEQFETPLVKREFPDPELGPQDVLLKVKACGVCRTDVKIWGGKMPSSVISLPHIMGHEVAGEIVDIGGEVKDMCPGDKGVVYFYKPCRNCQICLRGKENVCPQVKRYGFELSGGFATYIKIPAYNLCTFQADIPFHEVAVVPDAIATCYHAIKTLADVRMGDVVLVVGVGGLGIHAVQIARLCGAQVLAADVNPKALNLAKELGADDTINCREKEPLQAVKKWTNGRGVDVVLELVGSSSSLEWSLCSLRPGGCVVVVGYSPGDPWPIDTVPFHFYEWNARGCRASTKQECTEALKLVERKRIKSIVSKIYSMNQANEALEDLKKGGVIGRVVLVTDE